MNLRVTLGLDKWQTLFLLLVGYRQNSAYRGTAFFFYRKRMKAKVSRDKIPLLFSFVIVLKGAVLSAMDNIFVSTGLSLMTAPSPSFTS